jgi:hypothetical protein
LTSEFASQERGQHGNVVPKGSKADVVRVARQDDALREVRKRNRLLEQDLEIWLSCRIPFLGDCW